LEGDQSGDPAQALRRHLIEVTQRLLASHGLTGMTTRAIARDAQVSDGVLYNHFAGKDDLIVSALADQIIALVRHYLADCPEPGDQDLRAGLDRLARLSLTFQADALPLIGALLSRPDLIHQLLMRLHANDPGPQLLWERIVRYVRGEQHLGTVAADVDPLTVAQIIFGVQHLAALFAALGPSPAQPPPDALPDHERLVDFLVRACTPRP
jgi:AcrR family transcriptional regulator